MAGMKTFKFAGFNFINVNTLLAASALIALTACNANKESCTVSGNTITCPNGSSTTIPEGEAGGTGEPGVSGAVGVGSGIFSTVIAAGNQECPQGNGGVSYTTFIDHNNTGVYASNDTVTSVNYICNGATGAAGTNGTDGTAGTSSSVNMAAASVNECPSGGWDITMTNAGVTSQPYPLCNGADGTAGATGATGDTGATGAAGAPAPTYNLSLVQLIAPCGEASSDYKEQLMLFSDGSLLADFSASSDADTVRLSFIPDGVYIDTDDSGCEFTVSTSGATRTLTWGAGSSSDDPSGWSAGGWSWGVPVTSSGATAM
jgi:hypothetical protein